MIDRVVGANVSKLRRLRRLSIEQLAAACTMTVAGLEACETGDYRLHPSELLDLARALDVELDQLFQSGPGMEPIDTKVFLSRRRAAGM
jgi:transcriptional regulator with XRE-family HTH domain